jgi:hypothetical protein
MIVGLQRAKPGQAKRPMYEITESYLQLEKAFAGLAANARNGEVGCMPGVTSNWCGTLWPLGNQLIFNAPITAVADMQARIAAVNQYLASKSKMGVVVVPAQFVSIEFQEACVTAMEREGFVPIMTLMGMAADSLQATCRLTELTTFLATISGKARHH